jgi:branched-chain amino acid transport system substrate-binding protein
MKLHFIAGVGALFLLGTAVGAQAQDHCGLSNGKKATGEPIQIGAIFGKTGPEDFSTAGRAAEAYFKCVNANGGIHGRPIVYTVLDDNWNPEVAAQVANKLVKDTKIVGAVGSTSFVECTANNKLYEQEGVAVIAGVGATRACFYGPNYAPFNQGPRLSTVGAAQYLVETFKVKSIVCVAPGIPGFGDWVCNGVENYAKANGVTPHTVIFDPGRLDGNAIALQIAATKAEAVVLGMPRGMMLPILTAAEQQDMGKNIKWTLPTSAYNTQMPKAAGKYWDGKLYVHMELEPLDKGTPDMKNWLAIMAKYGNKSDQIDSFSQAGHLAARAATEALLSIKGPIDRKSVYEAFKAVRNLRTDMLCAPWYFGPGNRHQGNHTGRVAQIVDGKFKTVTECFQTKDPELADVNALEAKGGLVN